MNLKCVTKQPSRVSKVTNHDKMTNKSINVTCVIIELLSCLKIIFCRHCSGRVKSCCSAGEQTHGFAAELSKKCDLVLEVKNNHYEIFNLNDEIFMKIIKNL